MPATHACPHCEAALPDGAVLCVNCGYHLEKGERLRTVRQRLRRTWETGLTSPARLGGLAVVVLGGVAFAVFVAGGWWCLPLCAVVGLVLAALGSRIVLERDRSGRPWLTVHGWFLLLPVRKRVIDLRRCDSVLLDYAGNDEAETYYVEVDGKKFSRPIRVYAGSSERVMREITDALQEVAGLEVKRK
jgi:hypothetical protein